MNQSQHNGLEHSKQCDIDERRQPLFHAVFAKVRSVVVLDECLNNGDRHIPQSNDVEGDTLVHIRCSMEIMIAIHAQLLVMVFDDVIDYLVDGGK